MKRFSLITLAAIIGALVTMLVSSVSHTVVPTVDAQRQQLMFGTNPYTGGSNPLAVRLTPDGRIQMSSYVRSNAALPGTITTLAPGTAITLAAVSNSASYFTGGTRIHQTTAVLTGGPPTACTLQLQGSLDNVNFYNVGGALTCTATVSGAAVDVPVLFIRYALTTLTGAGSLAIQYGGA